MGNSRASGRNDWVQKQAEVNAYLDPALEIYFSRMGINPFVEGEL